jgi:tellurite resistance-related uncharacterized protein
VKLSNEQIDQFVELCNHGEYIELEKKLREVLGGNIPNALLAEITTARGCYGDLLQFRGYIQEYHLSDEQPEEISHKIQNSQLAANQKICSILNTMTK